MKSPTAQMPERYMPTMGNLLKLAGLWLTLTFTSVHAFAGDTTEIRKHILKVAKQIAKYKTVDNKAVGFAGQTSEQYKRFYFLSQQATDKIRKFGHMLFGL